MVHRSQEVTLRAITKAAILLCVGLLLKDSPVRAVDLPKGILFNTGLGYGYDDNIFREPDRAHFGSFMPYDAGFSYTIKPDIASRLRLSLDGSGEVYPTLDKDANTSKYGAKLEYDRRLWGGKRGVFHSPSLDMNVSTFFDGNHQTYFSRTAGEEYAVISNGKIFSLKNRFNWKRFGGAAEIDARWPRRTQWAVEGTTTKRNYDNDYESIPSVDPLDYDYWKVRIRVTQDIGRPVEWRLEYARSEFRYRARRARDFDGNIVDGVFQSFEYNNFGTRLKVALTGFGDVNLSVNYETRRDQFQGYYDYEEWSFEPGIHATPLKVVTVNTSYGYSHRTYDRAHVSFNPVRPLREDYDRAFFGEILYQIGSHSLLFARVIHDDTDEKNPVYTYERTRSMAGYEFHF